MVGVMKIQNHLISLSKMGVTNFCVNLLGQSIVLQVVVKDASLVIVEDVNI